MQILPFSFTYANNTVLERLLGYNSHILNPTAFLGWLPDHLKLFLFAFSFFFCRFVNVQLLRELGQAGVRQEQLVWAEADHRLQRRAEGQTRARDEDLRLDHRRRLQDGVDPKVR